MDKIKLHQFAEKLELRGYAKRTIFEYCDYVRRFLLYLEEKESVETLDEVLPNHISAWHGHLRFVSLRNGSYMSNGTIRTRLIALKMFYRIMRDEKLVGQDYAPLVVLPKEIKSLPRHVPSEAQMSALLDSVRPLTPLTIRDRCMLELLYATAIRNEELRTLTMGAVDFMEQTLFIKGKGSKDRIVPLGEWVIPYLKEYLVKARPLLISSRNPTDVLFVSKSGRVLTGRALSWIVGHYCKKAGIADRITPHGLRHACATHLLAHGADIRYVQELLGHERLTTTQIYTKIDISQLKKAHSAFHPRERQTHENPS